MQYRHRETITDPASRCRPSPHPFPDTLPPIEHGDGDTVVTVKANGAVRFRGHTCRVSKVLRDLPIDIRPDPKIDGRFNLFFRHHKVALIDLAEGPDG